MRVIQIIEGTTVDGPGIRTAIYFAGCSHHCPGCQNPSTWNPESGHEMSLEEILLAVDENDCNVTFSGGDPLYQAEMLAELSRLIKQAGRNIWCYTGYTFEQVLASERLRRVLDHIDVMVDGRFDLSLRNTDLIFKGSSNQRIIDVAASLAANEVVLWHSDF